MSEAQNIYNSPSTESYEVEAGQETHLKRVGVLSCAIVLAVLYALLGLFAGGIMFLVSLAGAGAAASSGAGGDVFAKLGIGGAALVIFIPVIYGIMGFIGGALMAVIYNLVAKITGGLKLTFN